MNTIVFVLYAVIFASVWYVFNQYFKDHTEHKKQPIPVNSINMRNRNANGNNLQRRMEHFTGDAAPDESRIREMVEKALGQINGTNNNMKPKVDDVKKIETDMELYLIGPDKDHFYKNLQKKRQEPTSMVMVKPNDMDAYFGKSKKDNNLFVSML